MSHTSSPSTPDGSTRQLAKWLHQTLRYPGVQMRCRVRGNILHLLYEGDPTPKQDVLTYHVLEKLNKTDINKRGNESAPIYQVWLYGRCPDQAKPTWTFRVNLDQLGHYLHHFTVRGYSKSLANSSTSHPSFRQTSPSTEGAIPSTSQTSPSTTESSAAEYVAPEATRHPSIPVGNDALEMKPLTPSADEPASIARQLSETLSQLGVSVKVRAKTLSQPTVHTGVPSVRFPSFDPSHSKRLFVLCQAAYSPSSALIAEPIARKLRSLNLTGVQDALLSVCVNGEEKPDWTLRIDLTPANTLLREWAQWGDIEALSHLVNQALEPLHVQVTTASYQETTLHFACQPVSESQPSADFPASAAVTETVQPLLEALSPQGVQAVVLYGHLTSEDTPQWVEYLTLFNEEESQCAIPPLTLAQEGHLEAIAYLMSRLLNPDLDTQLATGGIRVQLLQKDQLLHVMCDAPICPDKDGVTASIIRLLDQIRGTAIAGVRIYGRQAGARTPNWHSGKDFVDRSRPELQSPPEFATSDASYVNDLLAAPDESPLREDLTASELWARWARMRQRVAQRTRRSLLKTQLVALTSDSPTLALPHSIRTHGLKTAMVWAAVGVLSVVQLDWLMSRMNHTVPQGTSDSALTLTANPDNPSLNDENIKGGDEGSEFGISSAASDVSGASIVSLVSGASAETLSALQSELLEQSPYPTFNSDQLDLKLAIYYQHVAEFGPPDVLVIGSSRALRGVDPVVLEETLSDLGYDNADVFNFGINGATAKVVELVLHRILVPEQLPELILWADGARAFNGGREDRTYNGIAESEGYQILSQGGLNIPIETAENRQSTGTSRGDSSAASGDWLETIGQSIARSYDDLDAWLSDQLGAISMSHPNRDELKALLQDTLTGNAEFDVFSDSASESFSSEESSEQAASTDEPTAEDPSAPTRTVGEINPDGFLPLDVRFDPVTYYDQYERVPGNYDRDYANFQLVGQQADALQTLLQLGNEQDVPIVFVNLPLTEEYLDPYRMAYEQEFRQHLLSLDLAHEEFIFRDLSALWLEGEQPDYYQYFSDPSHLNQYGAVEVSKRLAQDPMIPWRRAEF
ncbi:MAG: hypothetical protein VKL39_09820 [Leptolyngbyaceae bacterium]|nr:hypothetical protein [Leptolyngbyaceae bacterium]